MRRTWPALFALCLVTALRGAAFGVGITYTVTPVPDTPNGGPAHTRFTVELTGTASLPAIRLQMPTWSPGDYEAQNHGRYVHGVRAATASGGALPVTHPDANTWEVDTQGSDGVTVWYELPNVPPGNFTENVQVTRDFAFYQGSASFPYLVDHKGDPAIVRVRLPRGWAAALSPMDSPKTATAPGEVAFEAPNYDTLADSPILAGQFSTAEFQAAGAAHIVAVFGWTQGHSARRYADAIHPVVDEELRLMGGPPYLRYVFFIHVGGRGGALEHAASCRIGWGAYSGETVVLQEFAAHEYFHLWNVKRIRPAVLGPFDYVRPPRTRLLWFCEGVTDYVALLSLRRAGVLTDARYLAQLSGDIAELQQTAARKSVTAEDASYRVWDTQGSSGYGGLSYYLKGHLIGLCLDLKLRELTNGSASIDRLMRDLLRRYGPPKPGYPENGIRGALIEAGGDAMGRYYDRMGRSTEELPFDECLAAVGLRLSRDWQIEADANATPDQLRLRRDWLNGTTPAATARRQRARQPGSLRPALAAAHARP